MSRSLQAWSPRTHPLYYDALQQDVGCSDTTGSVVYTIEPFIRLCVAEHDPHSSSAFNQSPITAYSDGPSEFGDPHPWLARWAAWVSSAGVRMAKLPLVTPPANTTGIISPLYGDALPTRLSLGFTAIGQPSIAIQKTATSIEVKWIDVGGEHTKSFVGTFPVLFNDAELFSSDLGETDLACFYLRLEEPRKIFARFEREGFLNEYIINGNLQAKMTSLISSSAAGNTMTLLGRDVFGRDVTLRSAPYASMVTQDEEILSIELLRGSYAQSAIPAATAPDGAMLSVSVESGVYHKPIIEPGYVLSGDEGQLTLAIVSGEYSS